MFYYYTDYKDNFMINFFQFGSLIQSLDCLLIIHFINYYDFIFVNYSNFNFMINNIKKLINSSNLPNYFNISCISFNPLISLL